jgi:hypothetical protein
VAKSHAPRRDAFALSATQPPATVVEPVRVDLYYDYDLLPAAYRARAMAAAQSIKLRLKRAAVDIFIIGAELNAVKEAFPHGEFGIWLEVEFDLSPRMAQRFMNVAQRLMGKSDKFSLLPPSALYLLAAPSTPDRAIREIEQKLDAGKVVRTADVAEIVASAREDVFPSPSRPPVVLSEADRRRARRLARRLADAAARLEGRGLEDWAALMADRRLSRVHATLVEMLEDVQELLIEPRFAAASPLPDDLGDGGNDPLSTGPA